MHKFICVPVILQRFENPFVFKENTPWETEMNNTIPHQLIDQCRQNDRNAQLQLYRQYCQAMFHTAHRLMGNVQDAEDTMQEAFISAFQKMEQYRGEVAFGAWLKRIVINKCLDALKKQQKRLFINNDLPIAEIADEKDSWEVEDSVTIEDVKKAILGLPDKYRSVLMLYLIEGYNHEEIAQIMDIAIATSRSQLMRGKQKLRMVLKQQCYG